MLTVTEWQAVAIIPTFGMVYNLVGLGTRKEVYIITLCTMIYSYDDLTGYLHEEHHLQAPINVAVVSLSFINPQSSPQPSPFHP